MKTIKLIVVLISCFVILSSSFVVGAAEDVLYTADDLIDMGFVEGENDNFVYYGAEDPFSRFSLFSSSEKNYPDFDPTTDIPWSTFPQYIKDILSMSLDDLKVYTSSPIQLPFFLMVVSENSVNIYAGINIGLGKNNLSSMYSFIYSITNSNEGSCISPYSVCYRADFNYLTQSYTNDWYELEPSDYGDMNNLQRFTPYSVIVDSSVRDLYFYGANGVTWALKLNPDYDAADSESKYIETVSSLVYRYNSSNSNQYVTFRLSPSGFQSGYIVPGQDNYFPYCYFQYFVPPSEESINQQLQQEQNDLLEEGNVLQQEQNEKLDEMMDATGTPDSIVDDYNKAESDLVDDYNPDNLEDDLDIELDSSALEIIWWIFDYYVTADNAVFTLFISIMAVGIIALILGR